MFLLFGALLACRYFPIARGLQQKPPSVEARFRHGKELINTTIFYDCSAAHDLSPRVARNSWGFNLWPNSSEALSVRSVRFCHIWSQSVYLGQIPDLAVVA
jgi:hypothetical protein